LYYGRKNNSNFESSIIGKFDTTFNFKVINDNMFEFVLNIVVFRSVSNEMSKDVIRLMTAVSVGYGAFNLILSLVSPMMIPLIGMLGFRGNRRTGLDALMFAKNGPDVHAPLAW